MQANGIFLVNLICGLGKNDCFYFVSCFMRIIIMVEVEGYENKYSGVISYITRFQLGKMGTGMRKLTRSKRRTYQVL
jgi:hypothetical protein